MVRLAHSVGAPLLGEDQEDVIQVASDFALRSEVTGNETDGQFNLGTLDDLTNPEDRARARREGKNQTLHVTAGRIVVYDLYGNARSISESDVFAVIDSEIRAERRLYLRCPQCRSLPNRGIHAVDSPNGCPGRDRIKWMPCLVCQAHGVPTRIWEERMDPKAVDVVEDEDYVAPKLPGSADREQALQFRLNVHMAAFHPSEARSMYGIKREEYFR